MKQPKVERRPLCPLAGFAECRGERCMIWDDDWRVCSLNNGSLYSMVRAAVCDAAVEIAREGGRPLPPPSGAPSPKGEGFRGGDGLDAEQIINIFQAFIRTTRDEITAIRKQFGEAGKRD